MHSAVAGRLSPWQLARAGWHRGFKCLAMLHINAAQLGTSCQSPRGSCCHLLHSWSCQLLSLIHDDRLDELKCAGWAVPRGMWWGAIPGTRYGCGFQVPPRPSGRVSVGPGLARHQLSQTPVILRHGKGREPWWSRRESGFRAGQT